MKQLEMNILEKICKLEIIFSPSFFDLKEHMTIHLAYLVKIKGHVHYIWMYLYKRLGITCMLSNCLLFFCKHLVTQSLFTFMQILIQP